MKRDSIRRWYQIHKWSSLICTLFLLLLCLTGLPLIFHDELTKPADVAPHAANARPASLDQIVAAAQKAKPGEVVLYISKSDDDGDAVTVTTADSISAPVSRMHPVLVDEFSAQVLPRPASSGFFDLMLHLHTNLCAGNTGSIILALMALLFVASIVSGIVVYGPFTKRWQFGTVRVQTGHRTRWLDIHNLFGIVTVCWLLVVGVTGAINALDPFVAALWQSTELRAMVAPFKDKPAPAKLSSLQAALDRAHQEDPGTTLTTFALPGTPFASPRHYGIYLHGNEPLTSRILRPLLIDAETGEVAAKREMPWYVKVFFLSQPLHFGDYGGLPLKFLWAGFDMVTIAVLVSGLWLWRLRGRSLPEIETEQMAAEAALTESTV